VAASHRSRGGPVQSDDSGSCAYSAIDRLAAAFSGPVSLIARSSQDAGAPCFRPVSHGWQVGRSGPSERHRTSQRSSSRSMPPRTVTVFLHRRDCGGGTRLRRQSVFSAARSGAAASGNVATQLARKLSAS
jgi:hypothetical protein